MLDPNTLQQLRESVKALDSKRQGPKAHGEIAKFGSIQGLDGVMVDLDSSEQLGVPMVVVQRPAVEPECFRSLTVRERHIATLIAEGLSNKEIANRLTISLSTVKDHVHHILTKTGLSNRAAIASARSSSR